MYCVDVGACGDDGNGGDGSCDGGDCVVIALLNEEEPIEAEMAPRFFRKNDGGVDAILDSAVTCVPALSCFLALSRLLALCMTSLFPDVIDAVDRLVADT